MNDMTREQMQRMFEQRQKLKKYIRKLKREKASGGLGMNSLMDILTILLIFLLKSFSSKADAIKMSDELRLPSSSGILKMEQTIRVYVTKSSIKVEGDSKKRVVKLMKGSIDPSDMANGDPGSHVIATLREVLEEKAEYLTDLEEQSDGRRQFEGKITIVCDRTVPYRIINDVVYTAAVSSATNADGENVGFKNVKFAVIQGG